MSRRAVRDRPYEAHLQVGGAAEADGLRVTVTPSASPVGQDGPGPVVEAIRPGVGRGHHGEGKLVGQRAPGSG
jgi:hypothetical protein